MTVGHHGTHVNVGLPGTGISYRTKIAGGGAAHHHANAKRSYIPPHLASVPKLPPDHAPHHPPFAPQAIPATDASEIRSSDIATLTSPGLGELKRLINEASVRRETLAAEVTANSKQLLQAKGTLTFAQTFIIRIFMSGNLPRLKQTTEAAELALQSSQDHYEHCYIEVDFGFNDLVLSTYDALIESFKELCTCQGIWDITAVTEVNSKKERTVASESLSRVPVSFALTDPEILRSSHMAMRLGNVGGRDITLLPGFITMRDSTRDFALIEYSALEIGFSDYRVIEEDEVFSDTESVGQTWKKVNKDGSADKRFKSNYSLPIIKYGKVVFGSPEGLVEVYMFSNYDKAEAFALALHGHKLALATFSVAGGSEPASGQPLVPDVAPCVVPNLSVPSAALDVGRPSLVLDWTVLIMGLIILAGGVIWM